ncbi:MAG: HAD-IA family hydrolase [Oscillospiraceae bacterium]|jgi:phosphoglycolate phosphatase|nr:HAD-IA family hydrolase [Oscillospiraceae bacterium]
MKFDYVLLDLDGTLTNPVEGITKSINYAMEKMGKPLVPDSLIPKFIGPPLRAGFMQNVGFTEEEAERALELYRERYMPTGLYENELISGAKELLERLSTAGKTIAMATSKPEEMAIRLMEHFNLLKYFSFISAASMDSGGRHEKNEIIAHALEHLGIGENKLPKTVMVGDRFYDIAGAKDTGIASIAVLSGFGSREEFEEHGADYIAENLFEACDIILSE